jgi:hypothetical protein
VLKTRRRAEAPWADEISGLALSLLLSLATVALWVRSYSTQDTLSKAEPRLFRGFVSQQGSLAYSVAVVPENEVPTYSGWHWDSVSPPPHSRIRVRSLWNRLGFGTHDYKTNLSAGGEYWLPDWFLVFAATGTGVLLLLVLARRRKKANPQRLPGGDAGSRASAPTGPAANP